MGKVTVRLHTCLRSTSGKENVELVLNPNSDLGNLLHILEEEYPILSPLLRGESGYQHLMILVNNQNVGPLTKETLEKTVNDGDTVSILEPCAAG